MRPKSFAALMLAAMAAAAPISPTLAASARPAPQAADRTLGMALMSASVAPDGEILHRSGVVSAERTSTGVYIVDFVRSLDGCDFVVSPSNVTADRVGIYVVMAKRTADDSIAVVTFTPSFDHVDSPFSVITFCAE